jgi:hypothetical protein
LFERPEPLPWLAFEKRGMIGLGGGFSSSAPGLVGRVDAAWEFAQSKKLHGQFNGSLDTGGGWYVGARGEYRFK